MTTSCKEMSRKIKGLLINGTKFTASGDLEKATRCYAQILDLDSQNPEPYVLMARCLYKIGLKNNDMFGGGGRSSEEEDSMSQEEDVESDSENEESSQKPVLNSRLYQFDHEEEDMVGGDDVARVTDEVESDNVSNKVEDTVDEDLSAPGSFENYLQGDLFENAMELLYRARIMYMDSSTPLDQLPAKSQKKLVEIYDLLGDIDQELEDFSQAARDYEEAIGLCQEDSSQEARERVFQIYMKLAEALRWLDNDSDDSITKDQQKSYLLTIREKLKERIERKESIDIEEDESRLERIDEDLKTLKEGKPRGASATQQSIMQAILQEALGATQQGKVNDLSKMVKKKHNKKKNKINR